MNGAAGTVPRPGRSVSLLINPAPRARASTRVARLRRAVFAWPQGAHKVAHLVDQVKLWVPDTRLTPADLLLRLRRKPGMIPRWRCG